MKQKHREFTGFILLLVISLLGSEVAMGEGGLDSRFWTQYQRVVKKVPQNDQGKIRMAVKQFEMEVANSPDRIHYLELAKRTSRVLDSQGEEGLSVEEAAYLVMMEAVRDLDDDLRWIMAEIKAMSAAKQELREMIKDLNQWISEEMSEHRGSEDIENQKVSSGLEFQQLRSPHYRIEYSKAAVIRRPANPKSKSLPKLRNDKSVREADLAKMGKMSEDLRKKLQLWTDRRDKMKRLLFDLFKRIDRPRLDG